MNSATASALLTAACQELGFTDRCMDRSAEEFVAFGGVDTEDLTTDDVIAGVNNEDGARWRDLAFGADEVLALLQTVGATELTKTSSVTAFVCGAILCHAIARGYGDWEFSLDKLLYGLYRTREYLSPSLRLRLLQYVTTRQPRV